VLATLPPRAGFRRSFATRSGRLARPNANRLGPSASRRLLQSIRSASTTHESSDPRTPRRRARARRVDSRGLRAPLRLGPFGRQRSGWTCMGSRPLGPARRVSAEGSRVRGRPACAARHLRRRALRRAPGAGPCPQPDPLEHLSSRGSLHRRMESPALRVPRRQSRPNHPWRTRLAGLTIAKTRGSRGPRTARLREAEGPRSSRHARSRGRYASPRRGRVAFAGAHRDQGRFTPASAKRRELGCTRGAFHQWDHTLFSREMRPCVCGVR
jgi:hypothetical protein